MTELLQRAATLTLPRQRTARPAGTPSRPGVPWVTVLSLAVVLAYADGFWATSLRGAVGPVDRVQTPFTSWLRESTLSIPVFVVAVLGAVALSARLFGPELARRGSRAVTSLLVVAAGVLTGTVVVAANSAYDLHKQLQDLRMMGSMGTSCTGGCLAELQHNTWALQVHAVVSAVPLLLVTNLVLVAWITALRGGRLDVASARPELAGSRSTDLRVLLAAGLAGSAAIHAAVVPEHLAEWALAGQFFVVLVAVQLVVAGLVLARPGQRSMLAALAVSAGPIALWLFSRTVGMPFGPETFVPEPVGLADCASTLLELGTLVIAAVLLRGGGPLRRPRSSAHVRGIALAAAVALTTVGLAGTSIAAFDVLGASSMQMPATSSAAAH